MITVVEPMLTVEAAALYEEVVTKVSQWRIWHDTRDDRYNLVYTSKAPGMKVSHYTSVDCRGYESEEAARKMFWTVCTWSEIWHVTKRMKGWKLTVELVGTTATATYSKGCIVGKASVTSGNHWHPQVPKAIAFAALDAIRQTEAANRAS